MRINHFIWIFLIFTASTVVGQGVYSNDYAVTKEGDTVHGFIQMLTDKKINIAITREDAMEVKKFRVSDLNCLVINDTVFKGIMVTEANGSKNQVLAKIIVEGPISLFERDISKTRMWKPTEEYQFTGMIGKVAEKEYFLQKGDQGRRVDESNFYELCLGLFRAKKRIVDRIKNKTYEYDDLYQMVLDYNYLIENNLE